MLKQLWKKKGRGIAHVSNDFFYSIYVSELIHPKMKKSQHLAVINKHINCT